MQTGEANSVTSTFVNVPWKSLLHRLTPGPPSPMQSESCVQGRPVVPSVTLVAPVPPSSKSRKIVPLLARVPLEPPTDEPLVKPLLAMPLPPVAVEAPLAEPVDPRLEPPLLPVPQSHTPNPLPSARQLCAPRHAPGPAHV